MQRSAMVAAADARICALGVLSHADHLDVTAAVSGVDGAAADAEDMDVQIEALPSRQQIAMHRNVLGSSAGQAPPPGKIARWLRKAPTPPLVIM